MVGASHFQVDALKTELENCFGKNPIESNDLSRIVNSNHFARLLKFLDDDKVSGKIVYGGEKDESKFLLTVIEEAKGDESLMVDPPELKRYEAWLMARQKPSGNFTSEATNLVASKIGELVEKNTQGTIVFEGRDDILTVALGINEHPGRIRTAPRGVGFKKFYGKSSRSTLGGVSQDDLLAHLQALEQKMNIDFQHKLQKHLQQQRTELQQQMQKEMQEERAQIQQGMKLLQ
ncbi:uncharacterized protein LOC127101890 [Lathyrus oleraceus]|uniref:uncharacterized protein LOC127101890 n=1 Tax=Pisum sativum TaxID=3888 RepID=UPI0021D33018|nr:uncharacterized protein LOC127101890 [Pisum sativum]